MSFEPLQIPGPGVGVPEGAPSGRESQIAPGLFELICSLCKQPAPAQEPSQYSLAKECKGQGSVGTGGSVDEQEPGAVAGSGVAGAAPQAEEVGARKENLKSTPGQDAASLAGAMLLPPKPSREPLPLQHPSPQAGEAAEPQQNDEQAEGTTAGAPTRSGGSRPAARLPALADSAPASQAGGGGQTGNAKEAATLRGRVGEAGASSPVGLRVSHGASAGVNGSESPGDGAESAREWGTDGGRSVRPEGAERVEGAESSPDPASKVTEVGAVVTKTERRLVGVEARRLREGSWVAAGEPDGPGAKDCTPTDPRATDSSKPGVGLYGKTATESDSSQAKPIAKGSQEVPSGLSEEAPGAEDTVPIDAPEPKEARVIPRRQTPMALGSGVPPEGPSSASAGTSVPAGGAFTVGDPSDHRRPTLAQGAPISAGRARIGGAPRRVGPKSLPPLEAGGKSESVLGQADVHRKGDIPRGGLRENLSPSAGPAESPARVSFQSQQRDVHPHPAPTEPANPDNTRPKALATSPATPARTAGRPSIGGEEVLVGAEPRAATMVSTSSAAKEVSVGRGGLQDPLSAPAAAEASSGDRLEDRAGIEAGRAAGSHRRVPARDASGAAPEPPRSTGGVQSWPGFPEPSRSANLSLRAPRPKGVSVPAPGGGSPPVAPSAPEWGMPVPGGAREDRSPRAAEPPSSLGPSPMRREPISPPAESRSETSDMKAGADPEAAASLPKTLSSFGPQGAASVEARKNPPVVRERLSRVIATLQSIRKGGAEAPRPHAPNSATEGPTTEAGPGMLVRPQGPTPEAGSDLQAKPQAPTTEAGSGLQAKPQTMASGPSNESPGVDPPPVPSQRDTSSPAPSQMVRLPKESAAVSEAQVEPERATLGYPASPKQNLWRANQVQADSMVPASSRVAPPEEPVAEPAHTQNEAAGVMPSETTGTTDSATAAGPQKEPEPMVRVAAGQETGNPGQPVPMGASKDVSPGQAATPQQAEALATARSGGSGEVPAKAEMGSSEAMVSRASVVRVSSSAEAPDRTAPSEPRFAPSESDDRSGAAQLTTSERAGSERNLEPPLRVRPLPVAPRQDGGDVQPLGASASGRTPEPGGGGGDDGGFEGPPAQPQDSDRPTSVSPRESEPAGQSAGRAHQAPAARLHRDSEPGGGQALLPRASEDAPGHRSSALPTLSHLENEGRRPSQAGSRSEVEVAPWPVEKTKGQEAQDEVQSEHAPAEPKRPSPPWWLSGKDPAPDRTSSSELPTETRSEPPRTLRPGVHGSRDSAGVPTPVHPKGPERVARGEATGWTLRQAAASVGPTPQRQRAASTTENTSFQQGDHSGQGPSVALWADTQAAPESGSPGQGPERAGADAAGSSGVLSRNRPRTAGAVERLRAGPPAPMDGSPPRPSRAHVSPGDAWPSVPGTGGSAPSPLFVTAGTGGVSAAAKGPSPHLARLEASGGPQMDAWLERMGRMASDQALRIVKMAVAEGRQVLTVALRPPELGQLRVALTSEAGRLRIVLSAQRPETAAALKAMRPRMHEALVAAGFDVASLEVEAGHRRQRRNALAEALGFVSAPATSGSTPETTRVEVASQQTGQGLAQAWGSEGGFQDGGQTPWSDARGSVEGAIGTRPEPEAELPEEPSAADPLGRSSRGLDIRA